MNVLTTQRSSSGSPRRVLLVGGDEFRSSCVEMDRELLTLTGSPAPRVAIIPTAAAFENPRLAAANGCRHFAGIGADAYPVEAINRSDAENPAIAEQVADADVIYFTGGSPEHLLSVLSESPLLAAVASANRAGAIWAGSSAGAMVLGGRMRRPSSPQGSAGLGVVPGVLVLPHHERSEPSNVLAQLSERGDTELCVLGIDGATGALLDGGGAVVLGAGAVTVYRRGDWRRCTAGDTIPGLSVNGPEA